VKASVAAARPWLAALVLAVAGGTAGPGCSSSQAPARPEWKVYLATDAPVPQFGDEVVVDVLDGSSQPPERFLDASTADRWPISFGIAPTDPHAPVRIRVRLFRLEITGSDGLPSGASLIDATASLPPADGVTTVALTLSMACFGLAADVGGAQTCDPTTGTLAAEPTLTRGPDLSGLPGPGSWAPAATVDCRGSVPAGMVCVPGGAFLLGSAHHAPVLPDWVPLPEHVVQLSPFALDVNELTVGTTRQLVQDANLPDPLAEDPTNYDSNNGPCTYISRTDPRNDAMPINCVTWFSAELACRFLGKRLPTEAEWEYAARNLTAESPYPWGSDPNACAYATVGRGRYLKFEATNCETVANGFAVGPVAGGSPQDRTSLGLLNLGGNLSEWVQDYFKPYSAPCWNPPGSRLLVDPVCNDSTMQADKSDRGGSWDQTPGGALAYTRASYAAAATAFDVGIRCAKSM
jgi:formylglycine-generating enzyme required for sulfatase activity